jgi:hypothetical protein
MSYVSTKSEILPAPELKKSSGIPLLRENSKQIPIFQTGPVLKFGV